MCAVVINVYGKAELSQIEKAEKQLAGMKREVAANHGPWSKLGSVVNSTGSKIAAGLAAAGVMKWLAGSKTAAQESETAQIRLMKSVEATGDVWGKQKSAVNALIEKHSLLAAVDDEDLSGAFSTLTQITGKTSSAMKNLGLVTDLARGANIDLNTAAKLVGKAAVGNTSSLSRYGIVLKEGATAQEALAELQKRYSGQAAEYGSSSAGASDKFKVALEGLQETVGGALLPSLTSLSGMLVGLLNRFQGLPGPAKNIIIAVAGIAAGAAMLAPFITSIIAASKAMQLAALASKVWTAAQWLFNAAMSANPIGLIVIAIAAVIAVFVLLWKKCDWFREFWIGLWEHVKAVAAAVWPAIQAVGAKIVEVLSAAWDAVSGALTAFWDWAGDFISKAVSFWYDSVKLNIDLIIAGFQIGWDLATTIVSTAIGAITTVIDTIKSIVEFLDGIWEAIKTGARIQWGLTVGVVTGAVELVHSTIVGIKDAIVGAARAIWDAITAAAQWQWDLTVGVVTGAVDAVHDAIVDVKEKIVDAAAAIWGAVEEKAKDAWEKIVGVVRTAMDNVLGFVDSIIGGVNWVITKLNKLAHTNIGTIPLFTSGRTQAAPAGRTTPRIMDNGGTGDDDTHGGGRGGLGGDTADWVVDLWNKLDVTSRLPGPVGGLFGNATGALYGMAKEAVVKLLTKYGGGPGQQIVDFAKSRLGDPYVWGGTHPGGFDCSGLIYWAYQMAGKSIPRTFMWGAGRQVSQSSVRPGDVLFGSMDNSQGVKYGHVKMYAGNGQTIESGSGGVHMAPADWGWAKEVRTYLAGGGITSGPRSGYPVMLHGTEAVLPLDNPYRSQRLAERAGYGGRHVTIEAGAVVVSVSGASGGDLERVVTRAVDDGLERLAREIAAA